MPIPSRDLARAGLETLPAAIGRAGVDAAWRFVEFFAATIRNRNTRAAYAQARALQSRGFEKRGVSGAGLAGGRGVPGIDAGERAEQHRRVRHGPRHRPGRVLAVGDRNNAGATDKTQRRLDAHQRIRV